MVQPEPSSDDMKLELKSMVEALLAELPAQLENQDLILEMLKFVLDIGRSPLNRGEIKIIRSTMQEFLRAFKTFSGYRERPKVSIFGSARTPPDSALYRHCQDFSAALAERGFMIITGAGPGIMMAGNQGATREHSFGVNISLPFEQSANPYIRDDEKLIDFKYFFARKLAFVKESSAVVLFPGGMGTLDEGFETLTLIQTGKCNPIPVIMIDIPGGSYWIEWEMFVRDVLLDRKLISPDDFNLFRYTTDIDKAIGEIELFYKNYHSLRYVGDHVIIRLKRQPTQELLDTLNERYSVLLADGRFEVMDAPHRAERNEAANIQSLPRIAFHFVQRRFGTLRRMIDSINLTELGDDSP